MAMRILLLVLIIIVAPSGAAVAQFLLPLTNTPQPVQGANGSLWDTQLYVHNGTSESIYIGSCVDFFSILRPMVPPGFTGRHDVGSGLGAIRCVIGRNDLPRGLDGVGLHLRVQDLSRQSQTWGTEIPIVPRAGMLDEPVALINVPVNQEFRQALRVYAWDSSLPHRFHVEFLSASGALLAQEELATSTYSTPSFPGFAQRLALSDDYPAIAGEQTVTIRITPLSPNPEYWAFVSVTNNETQHVTLITPQPLSR
jgi:hypothetical protein